jgi:hypothetical protein
MIRNVKISRVEYEFIYEYKAEEVVVVEVDELL